MKYTSIAVLCLIGSTSAVQRRHHHHHRHHSRPQQAPVSTVQLARDPLYSAPGRNEWAFKTAEAKGPDYPVDYFVPHYGEDKEISGTKASIATVEGQMGHF